MKILANLVAPTVLCALAACSTISSGTGVGSTLKGELKTSLSWTAKGDRSGTMTAQVSNGETYTGTYFQITRDTRIDDLSPLWNGWDSPRWGSWWGMGPWVPWRPSTGFVTTYSGHVVANLEGPNGTHMRCRLDLMSPTAGMAGGGQGQCQLPGGDTIDTNFAPS